MLALTAATALSYSQGNLWTSVVEGRLPFTSFM